MENHPKITKIFFALSNPNRIKIYDLCLKEKLNISEISKKINMSYKSVLNNLKILEEGGFISKEKNTTDKAQETLISSIKIREGTVYEKFYEEIKAENGIQ